MLCVSLTEPALERLQGDGERLPLLPVPSGPWFGAFSANIRFVAVFDNVATAGQVVP